MTQTMLSVFRYLKQSNNLLGLLGILAAILVLYLAQYFVTRKEFDPVAQTVEARGITLDRLQQFADRHEKESVDVVRVLKDIEGNQREFKVILDIQGKRLERISDKLDRIQERNDHHDGG